MGEGHPAAAGSGLSHAFESKGGGPAGSGAPHVAIPPAEREEMARKLVFVSSVVVGALVCGSAVYALSRENPEGESTSQPELSSEFIQVMRIITVK